MPSFSAHVTFISCSNHITEHRKSHGVASFSEVSKSIGTSWKTIDCETLAWCTEVERVSSFFSKHRPLCLPSCAKIILLVIFHILLLVPPFQILKQRRDEVEKRTTTVERINPPHHYHNRYNVYISCWNVNDS